MNLLIIIPPTPISTRNQNSMSDNNLEPRKFERQTYFKTADEFVNGGANEEGKEARRRYLALLEFPEWGLMTQTEQAEALGVTQGAISQWKAGVPVSVWDSALKISRERHAKGSLEVDSSLMRQCKEGNVKAMDLYYRRIEGWVPKQDMELTRGRDKELDGKANFDLLRELVKGLSPAERRELIGEVPQGAIEANVERIEGGGGGS